MKRDIFAPESATPAELAQPGEKPSFKPEPRRSSGQTTMRLLIVDDRPLDLECFSRSLELLHPGTVLAGFDSVEQCLRSLPFLEPPDTIILRVDQIGSTSPGTLAAIRSLVVASAPVPVVVLFDVADVARMIAVLDCGVAGCIPASIGLSSIIEAVRLVAAGCFLLTPEGLAGLRDLLAARAQVQNAAGDELTSRQALVAEALRRGKSNKMIAYELNMCENTVKVHVRSILKRLHVTNRTEAAFKLNAATSTDP